jgi:hypothetical protein
MYRLKKQQALFLRKGEKLTFAAYVDRVLSEKNATKKLPE